MLTVNRSRRIAIAALALASTLGLAACSSNSSSDAGSGEAAASFPVTIANTFGSTTIDKQPERVATLGWGAQDIMYKLGVTPVGMPKQTYGAEDNGVMPWTTGYYDASKTELLDTTNGEPFERLAALNLDAVLAPYAGFDAATYEQLSRFVPTVAYPGKPYQTSWQDQTRIVGEALGKQDDAGKAIDELQGLIDRTKSEHPEYQGKTISVIDVSQPDTVNVYLPSDPRVALLNSLGFSSSPGVEKLAASGGDQFYAAISRENIADIDADVVIAFSVTDSDPTTSPTFANLGATRKGGLLAIQDTKIVAGLSQAGVLATPWVLDKLTPMLTDAVTA